MMRTTAPEMIARFGKSAAKVVKEPEFAYGLPGASGFFPVNNPGFDPLGFTEGKSKDEVFRLREAEITHARVAMLDGQTPFARLGDWPGWLALALSLLLGLRGRSPEVEDAGRKQ